MTPGNNVSWRLTVVERRLERLEEGKPDVIAERVSRLAGDVEGVRQQMHREHTDLREETRRENAELREELETQRKILIGFFVSFALLAVGIALSYLLGGGPAG